MCKFRKAPSILIPGWSAFSHDQMARHLISGLRSHARLSRPGILSGTSLAPARVHDLQAVIEVLGSATGLVLADRNYWNPERMIDFEANGIPPLASFRIASR